MFTSYVKQNNDSNKNLCVHDLLLHRTYFVSIQWFISCRHKINCKLLLAAPNTRTFDFFRKII
jgi:hypothetical protein